MEHKEHHKREIYFLLGFLIIFCIVFLIALLKLRRGDSLLGIGLSYITEDAIILVLSSLAMIKAAWHIVIL